ncbi:MAG: trehalose-6-phosphate synthase [Thermaerobacter sp.]|jgi:trehalose 6-phosphate synthase|nr:trehalose-6-phosphate synthase [Thermaerobacter sp.]
MQDVWKRWGALAAEHPLLVISRRGPVVRQNGTVVRGPGGLATALGQMAEGVPFTWLHGGNGEAIWGRARLRGVPLPPAVDAAHAALCNRLLWFVQHGLDGASPLPAEWFRGYLAANSHFAAAAAALLPTDATPVVFIHDYHFYLLGRELRRRRPDALLAYFLHIPWPPPAVWRQLPPDLLRHVCRGLLANDSLGFQTEEDAANFRELCLEVLPEASTDSAGILHWHGRQVLTAAYPISVDPAALAAAAAAPEVERYRELLGAPRSMRTLIRVDRLDPSKNVLAGFQALDLLLRRAPHWRGRLRFLAFLVPTRQEVPEYREYARRVLSAAQDINRRYQSGDWLPVQIFHEHNRAQSLAAMSLYDVLLVNPLADGMNLVAKEGPVINSRHGALVLSSRAGAYRQLREAAIPVEPADVVGTAQALGQALELSRPERRRRSADLRRAVLSWTLWDWLEAQLGDVEQLLAEQEQVAVH